MVGAQWPPRLSPADLWSGIDGGRAVEPIDIPPPTHWPSVRPEDAEAEWDALRVWVERLQRRFHHLDHHVIPACWWRHNEHVEALCALRDHERVSYSDTAPASAPADWFRTLRDITALLRLWTSELSCASIHHDVAPEPMMQGTDEWKQYVAGDVVRRKEWDAADS